MILLIPPECVQPSGNVVDGLIVAQRLRDAIVMALKELGLKLNPKSNIYPVHQGISFLGYRYKLTTSGRIVDTPLRRKLADEKQKLRRMLRKGLAGDVIDKHLASWVGHYKRCSGRSWLQKMQKEAKIGSHIKHTG